MKPVADELDVLNGGNAAGDTEDYLPSLQLLAPCAEDAPTRTHVRKVFTVMGLNVVDG